MEKLSLKGVLMLILSLCFVGGIKAQATKIDQNLWGLWHLESIEQLKFENDRITDTQEKTLNAMLSVENKSLPDILTAIHFFDDFTVGVCSLNKEIDRIQEIDDFLPKNINRKGTYQLNQNQIKIQVEEGIEFELIYEVNNNILEFSFRNTKGDDRDDQKLVYTKID